MRLHISSKNFLSSVVVVERSEDSPRAVFTVERENRLERIRAHLTEDLSIDREDFKEAPVLARAGGWNPAARTFEGNLNAILKALNEAIAAYGGERDKTGGSYGGFSRFAHSREKVDAGRVDQTP
jgi:hypothetical protein